ncbi:MAG: ATP phosphoribosyltransferase regulatory subunit [Isosphaeraceae bacterium]
MNAGPSETSQPEEAPLPERPVGLVRGTRDWLPSGFARLAELERTLLDQFRRAGYLPMRTPILEFAELHERKSGAGIVAKLFEVPAAGTAEICLRPELTASIVRAYTEAEVCPALPFRVSSSGAVFRFENLAPGRDREFTQVGVELIGTGGPAADAEVIWLAEWSTRALGIADAALRIGHVGLILELLRRSGLPPAAAGALVDALSEAAADGQSVRAIESALKRLADWLGSGDPGFEPPSAAGLDPDQGVDRLFRHLVPDVTGRRSGREIISRLRRKWHLGHTLCDVLARVRDQVHALADLRGVAGPILERLDRQYAELAPDSVAALRSLLAMLKHHGVETDRVELDLGFGRGIGFYTQMIFELVVPTGQGPVEVCGGGRYDGLAKVLGSNRDARGAGFAFGLERMLGVLQNRSDAGSEGKSGARGYLLTTGKAGQTTPAVIDLASFLRDRIELPVVVADLAFPAAIEHARALGLGHVVTVGGAIEVWNLEQGDAQSVRTGELIDLMRTHLAIFRGDRS